MCRPRSWRPVRNCPKSWIGSLSWCESGATAATCGRRTNIFGQTLSPERKSVSPSDGVLHPLGYAGSDGSVRVSPIRLQAKAEAGRQQDLMQRTGISAASPRRSVWHLAVTRASCTEEILNVPRKFIGLQGNFEWNSAERGENFTGGPKKLPDWDLANFDHDRPRQN